MIKDNKRSFAIFTWASTTNYQKHAHSQQDSSQPHRLTPTAESVSMSYKVSTCERILSRESMWMHIISVCYSTLHTMCHHSLSSTCHRTTTVPPPKQKSHTLTNNDDLPREPSLPSPLWTPPSPLHQCNRCQGPCCGSGNNWLLCHLIFHSHPSSFY